MKYYSDLLAEAGKPHLFDTKKELDEAEASHKAAIEESERLAKERNDAIDAITLAIEQFRTKYCEEYASAYSRKKFEEAFEKMKAKTTPKGSDPNNGTYATSNSPDNRTIKMNGAGGTTTNSVDKKPDGDGKGASHARPITFGEFFADLFKDVYGMDRF